MAEWRGKRTGKTVRELDQVTMPFGKYKGQRLEEVDIDYLDWIMGNVPLREPLHSQVADYLEHPSHEEREGNEPSDE